MQLRMALMPRSSYAILLFFLLGAFVIADLANALRTGRARGRYGTITRHGQPARFWRYIYGDYLVIGFCVAAIAWALLSPQSFNSH